MVESLHRALGMKETIVEMQGLSRKKKIYISVYRLIRGIIECESERLVKRQCQGFRRVD